MYRLNGHGRYGDIEFTDTLVTAPVQPPLDVDYAKLHIKSITDAEDLLVAGWILGAGSYFFEQTGRPPIIGTFERWLDRFPSGRGKIELPHPPLQSVISVQYVDGSGVLQDFNDGASPASPLYTVKAPQGDYGTRGWVEPIAGVCWPQTTSCESGAVRVQYTAGYGETPDDVPELAKAIMCWHVAHFDQFRAAVHAEFRESVTVLPFGVKEMIDGFKYTALPAHTPRAGGLTWR